MHETLKSLFLLGLIISLFGCDEYVGNGTNEDTPSEKTTRAENIKLYAGDFIVCSERNKIKIVPNVHGSSYVVNINLSDNSKTVTVNESSEPITVENCLQVEP